MSATTATPAPVPTPARRLTFRPGVHVLRRDAASLQVGLDPARAVVLPDTPEVRAVLTALAGPGSAVDPERYDAATLDLLAGSNLLVDVDRMLPRLPDGPGTEPRADRAGVAALFAQAGDAGADLLDRRATVTVRVLACGGAALSVATGVTALLDAAGVAHDAALDAARRAGASAGGRATVGLLVAVGEPARELLDPWVREGVAHLVLRLTEGAAVVGPFVEPGRTACLRCVDAHHTDVDPAWPLLVAQYASAAARRRQDTVPEPVDPALATLAGAWAARELVSHAEGRRPGTASTTVRLDGHLTELATDCWPRHPACGCAWS